MSTTTMFLLATSGFLGILVLILLVVIMRRGSSRDSVQLLPDIATIKEKLAHLEPMIQNTSLLQTDVRALSERISTVETGQGVVRQGVAGLATASLSALTELKALTTGLNESTKAIRVDLTHANTDLTELHTHVKDAKEAERETAESVRRIEAVIAGTQSKGLAGENVLELVFSKLPAEWQVRDFIIGGKCVEFALRLPNSLIVPIDSKWPATNLIEQFAATEDEQERQKLKGQIEGAVLQKAKEMRKYLDPSLTTNFGIAVIPDAVFDLCGEVQSDVTQLNVALISYSMFIPYLLLVFQTTLKAGSSLNLQKLDAYLRSARECIDSLQGELDGRFSRAITMMNNSRDEIRAVLGKLGGGLAGMQMSATSTPELPEAITGVEEGSGVPLIS